MRSRSTAARIRRCWQHRLTRTECTHGNDWNRTAGCDDRSCEMCAGSTAADPLLSRDDGLARAERATDDGDRTTWGDDRPRDM